jgi:hypothetical protein
MTNRVPLKNRRLSTTCVVRHTSNNGQQWDFTVTFGFDMDGRVRECFCNSPKSGTDMQAFISDACIAVSLLLQHGMPITLVAAAFGEDRPEGADAGPPSSPLGAIARVGVTIERDAICA